VNGIIEPKAVEDEKNGVIAAKTAKQSAMAASPRPAIADVYL